MKATSYKYNTEKKDIYTQVTERIINMINTTGRLPWQQEWQGTGMQFAISHATGKPYSFVNQFLLGMQGGEWITFDQCHKEGGHVKKGAKGSFVILRKPYEKKEIDATTGEETIKKIWLYKGYYVFRLEDTEGITPKGNTQVTGNADNTPCDNAEEVIKAYLDREKSLKFINDIHSNDAYFSPREDKVVVPNLEQFKDTESYYSTSFHELTHSTLIESRCNRKQDEDGEKACMGNAPYAKEELVAELGAAMSCAMLGISTTDTEKNSAAYVKGWLSRLQNDKTLIVTASTKAQNAVDYIFGV